MANIITPSTLALCVTRAPADMVLTYSPRNTPALRARRCKFSTLRVYAINGFYVQVRTSVANIVAVAVHPLM